MDESKTCRQCGTDKPLAAFGLEGKWRRNVCQLCRSRARDAATGSEYRKRNAARCRAYANTWRKRNRARVRGYVRTSRQRNPEYWLLKAAKQRAKKRGWPVPSIAKEDIVIPVYCPALGVKLKPNSRTVAPNSPTLDAIVPALYYSKGNVAVISHRANSIKSNASADELIKVAEWIKAAIDFREPVSQTSSQSSS